MIKKKDESKQPDKNEKSEKKDKSLSHEEIKALKQQNAELSGALQQMAADFDNFRRRQELARAESSSLATNSLILEIFPILDNFRRASEHAPSIEITEDKIPDLAEDDLRKISAYFDGVRQIEKQLETVLSNAGLKRVETINQQFDPRTMEAIAYEPHPELEEGTVIDELEGGYSFKDKVVRPAKVRVSSGQ